MDSRSQRAIELGDVTTGKVVQTFEADGKPVFTAVFSPDGRKLAGATRPNVYVWDLETGKLLYSLPRQNQYVAAFSRDGQHIATASGDHVINIRNAMDGSELLRLKGHTGIVLHATFSPDNKHLASISRDGTVRIWNLTAEEKADKP